MHVIGMTLLSWREPNALANEAMEGALTRTRAYVEAGADMIFTEAVEQLDQYKRFASELRVPILANITEFGKTPLFTLAELKTAGVSLALYPLSAFRAMSKAAFQVYNQLRQEGTQAASLDTMQTREELYQILDYYSYEEEIGWALRQGEGLMNYQIEIN